MADKYRTTGSDATVERFEDQGAGTGTNYWTRVTGAILKAGSAIIGKVGIDQTTPGTTNGVAIAPFPSSPTMTLYSPSTTAYVKVTPAATTLLMTVAPTVTTETLQYASLITHKIADVTTIAATNPATNDTTELYALADEVIDDLIVHIAATAYHATATGTITHTAATTEATAVTEVNLIRTNLLSHLASTTAHGGRADATNLALVTATSACTDKAGAVTLINLLATYYLAHLAVTDNSIYMTHGAAWMPLHWPCLGAFWCKTNVSAHTFATAEYASA